MAVNFGKKIHDLDPATSAASGDEFEFSLAGALGSRRITLMNILVSLVALFGFYALQPSEDPNTVVSKLYPYGDVRRYGAVGDGVADDTLKIQAAINAAPSGSIVTFPHGSYKITATLQINVRDLSFVGTNGTQTGINSTCATPIQLGTDNGHAYDAADYDGKQGFRMVHMGLTYTGITTAALANGQGTYGTGSYGIRDWRGGLVMLEDVTLQNFDFPFWGIQSDVNGWKNVYLFNNHSGCYFGPRSDQATLEHIWSGNNDTVFWVDSARGIRIRDWQTDNDGSATTYPLKVSDSFNRTLVSVEVYDPWTEHYGAATVVPAFVGAGISDTTAIDHVTIHHPKIFTNAAGASPRTKYLVEAGRVTGVSVLGVSGQAFFQDAVIHSINPTGTTLDVTVEDLIGTSMPVILHDGLGAVECLIKGWRNATYTTTQGGGAGSLHVMQQLAHGTSAGFRSNNGRWRGGQNTANTQRDWALSGSESTRQLDFFYPEDVTSGNQWLLQITRRIMYGGANPVLGASAWSAGDRQWNNGGSFGNPLFWKCLTSGTPGTWETVVAPSLSADRGDADTNVTWGAMDQFIRYATPLTAARAINLQSNQIDGNAWFLVARDVAATGAFNIVVKNESLATIATLYSPGQSCLVGWDRTAATWKVVATWTSQLPLQGSKTFDWASLATGAQQSTTVTVTGAALGDSASATMDVALSGTRIWAEVTAADTVTVYQRNDTGGAVDVPSGTLRARVAKA